MIANYVAVAPPYLGAARTVANLVGDNTMFDFIKLGNYFNIGMD
jgi:hypothetical protein